MSSPCSASQARPAVCCGDAAHAEPIACIVGPTASGKTLLAQELAIALDGEVVSADSMQVYRGMDIGTGKIPLKERRVPHHCIDICDPGDPYSAALYQSDARTAFNDIGRRGKRAVLCGGTGFYVRAAIDGFDFPRGEQRENPVREHYTDLAEKEGTAVLWNALCARDPESAALIHPHNIKRVVRAFELLEEGESYAAQRRKFESIQQLYPACLIGLAFEPAALNERIDRRVDDMVSAGLVTEVEHLLQHGFRKGITAPQAIGYKEIVAALDGAISLEEAFLQIKTATHRYAKRQRTWFKKDRRIKWLDAGGQDSGALVESALKLIEEAEARSS